MPLTFIVGGQYGGEGKGLITAAFAKHTQADILVKTGGPNSCHSYYAEGTFYRVRMLSSGFHFSQKTLVFPAGCLIYPKCLFEEIEQYQFNGAIKIDPNAGIITDELIEAQKRDNRYQTIGSTLTGTGYALAHRALRKLPLAKEIKELRPYLTDTQDYLLFHIEKKIIVEGSQAYGLSNYHGDYPYCTSRDTTVGSLLGQLGLGHKYVDQVILVIKALPTRNENGLGSLKEELSREIIDQHQEVLIERGGGSYENGDVTRRVGLFDFDIVKKAVIANSPDCLALTGLDKLKFMIQNNEAIHEYYKSIDKFKQILCHETNCTIQMESWGQNVENVKFF